MKRTPYLRPIATSSAWPSTLPDSANTELIGTAPGISFFPTSGRASATNFAGITKTATSISPSTSSTLS
jgi:hypothetical protein